ncbi:hypothetical protein [Streptococcus uberis]|uniref:hypothetical protein n=1 Tax=Streptococcus uberis TaxID=1349 RepID=UPI001FF33882|nr:hypothetical protein [Streptococcus uberis]MCK1215633.1 hypothetical protein [Streptococcus uberis]
MTNEKIRYIDDLELLGPDASVTLVIEGFNCLVRRVDNGHLCGYVEFPPELSQDPYNDIICHGGITYYDSDEIFPTENLYIGFDTAHACDWVVWDMSGHGTYKNFGYVVSELLSIIKQLKKFQGERE